MSAKIGARKLGQGVRIFPENQTMQKVKQFEIYSVSQLGRFGKWKQFFPEKRSILLLSVNKSVNILLLSSFSVL